MPRLNVSHFCYSSSPCDRCNGGRQNEGKVAASPLLIFFFIADFGVKQMNAIFSGEMKTTALAAAILPHTLALRGEG